MEPQPNQSHIVFNKIGILLRDEQQTFPISPLRTIFDRIGAQLHILNEGLPQEPLDLVIAMGGDGTVLKALDMMPACPVLAINYGTVGFLTAGDRDDLERLLFRLLSNDFILSERILLRCDYPGGTTHVVNEVVIRSTANMVEVDVSVNGAHIRTIRGDGVIAGTPTGSTGYLLSTGAPVVMPDVQCFVLDGINEYNFSSRALILSPDTQIRLHLSDKLHQHDVQLMVDGNLTGILENGQEVALCKSERRAQLIYFDPNYFFHNLSSRLSWN